MKKKKYVLLVLGILLLIGIGYAALSANLKINGSSGIKNSKWIIYFDNIENEKGRVISNATINDDKTEIDFTIELKKPGDLYEFNVDTVNDGTIDAMIESIEMDDIPEKYEDVITFKVTYNDGTELKECDELNAESRRNLRVYVLYREDIETSDLPEEEESISLKFKINYTQKGVCTTRNTLNIDPNGGVYNNSDKVTSVLVDKNSTYEVTVPTRSGFIFKGWSLEDGTPLEKDETTGKTTVNIETSDVTVKAVWEIDTTDYVARIENTYYETIQKAIDAAQAGDVIHLLKSTTESPTNYKNVTLNLENFTVTGTLTNTVDGNITLINGEINSSEIALVNNGTVTLGIKDGNYEINNIRIVGITIGLDQNRSFYFYDGFLQGLTGIEGGCNGKEDGYYIYVDSIKIDNIEYQKVYLIDHVAGNFMTINGEEFYFFSLQYAVASTDNQHPTVYVISENPESSAEVTVGENQVLLLDMNGNKLTYGAQLTNNGSLTVKDSGEAKGSFEISLPIINNNDLKVTDAVINQTTTNGNVVDNNSNLTINNSTLRAKGGYAINSNTAGNIVLDDNTKLLSDGYAFRNGATGNTSLTGGTISGINVEKGNLTITGPTVNVEEGYNAVCVGSNTNVTIKNGTYQSDWTATILVKSNSTLTIDNGTFNNVYGPVLETQAGSTTIINNGNLSAYQRYSSPATMNNNGTLTINGGTITGKNGISSGGTITVNDGELTFESNAIGGSKLYINGGTITSKYSAAVGGTTVMTGGTLISEMSSAFSGGGTITGGTLIGKQYGLLASGTVTIGNNEDEVVSTTKPVIIGELYGLYIPDTNTTVNFYDGILKGKTKGFYGTVKNKPSKYKIVEGAEIIEEETYNTTYLTLQNEFVKVGSTKFRSLQDAIDSIDEEGSMQLIEDATSSDEATIPSGKKITFDLNGKTYNSTETISNSGELIIDDDSDNKDGTLNNIFNTYTITTSGTLTVNNGNINSSYYTLYETGGTININGGSIEGGINNYSGNIKVTGGEITKSNDSTTINYNSGTLTVTGGTIKNTGSGHAIFAGGYVTSNIKGGTIQSNAIGINNSGTLKVDDGTITSTGFIAIANGGTATINGGSINSISNAAIGSSRTLTINGGTIVSKQSQALSLGGTVTINDGYFESQENAAIYNNSELTILGGTIIGKTNGIQNSSKITIGENDNTISKTTPEIRGEEYGIKSESGSIDFYDGILMGKTKNYSGLINNTPVKYIVVDGTKEIEGETYETAYLDPQVYYAEVGEVQFQSLQDAIDSIDEEGTIKIINNANFAEETTIPSGKKITINLNGKTLKPSKTITNNGELILDDTSDDKDGMIYNSLTYSITSSGTFTVNNGTITSSNYGIYETGGNVTINGGEITNGIYETGGNVYITGGKIKKCLYTTSGNVTMIGGEIISTTSQASMFYDGHGKLSITGGTITNTSEGQGITISHCSTCVIDDVIIRTSSGAGIGVPRYIYPTIIINNADIKSNNIAIATRSGYITINGGNFESVNNNTIGIESGYFTINGGTFKSTNAYALSGSYATINGGYFKSETKAAIQSGESVVVTGGKIEGKTYGIENNGTLTIGEKDGVIDASTPVIIGETYGLYSTGSSVSFYDGILKGKTGGYQGTIHTIEDNSIISGETEIIDEETYNTNFLTGVVEYVQNDRSKVKYDNLQTAVTDAQDNDELVFIDNGSIYYEVTVPNKTLTIDMNGYSLNTSKKITNNGVLTIENGTQTTSTISTTAAINLFVNNNDLTFDNTNLKSTNTDQYIILNNNSKTLSLQNTTINSIRLISNQGNNVVNLTNSTFNGNYGIENNTNSTLSLKDTNFNISGWGIYNYHADFTVDGGTLQGQSYYLVYNDTSTTENEPSIKNANIYSGNTITQVIQNRGNSTLKISNSNLLGVINNSGKMNYNKGTFNGKLFNYSEMTLEKITSTYESADFDATETIYNSSDLTIKDSSFITYNPLTRIKYSLITNLSNLTLENTDLEISTNKTMGFSIINNTGTLNYNKGNIKLSVTLDYDYNLTYYGLLNSSSAVSTLDIDSMDIDAVGNVYGVYNDNSNVTILNGNITVKGNNSYGVYQTDGEMIFGHLEGTGINANPSTTSPYISAIGTTTGIGVKKADGLFRFFDGKFVGSTNAKPEAPTQIEEPDYEVYMGVDENNYSYAILRYLEQH